MFKAIVVALVIAVTSLVAATRPAHGDTSCAISGSHCNVLIVETDDQSLDTMLNPDTLQPRVSYMPQFADRVASEPGWYTFTQARTQDPLCGPSRWGQLVGQTSIHHRATCNDASQTCANSTYPTDINRTYLAALHNAGYWNSFVGKFVNWYPCKFQKNANGTYKVPAGVNDWHVHRSGDGPFFNGPYDLIESSTGSNATLVHYVKQVGDADYGPYVERNKVLSAIDRCVAPCLWTYMTSAGHSPGTPPANYDASKVVPVPAHYPSYNEGCPGAVDPSLVDKPAFERAAVECDTGVWNRNKNQRPLQAEDTSITAIVNRLKERGLYDTTVIVFTSDHGYSYNENNHKTKESPYEPSMRVPLFVHVPGLPGGTINALTYLPDLAATLYDIAGATPLVATDGMSWLPLLNGTVTTLHDGVLGSHLNTGAQVDVRVWKAWYQDCSVHVPCYAVIRYRTGEHELYNLTDDPYELQNLLPNLITGYGGVPGYAETDPVVAQLEQTLTTHIALGA